MLAGLHTVLQGCYTKLAKLRCSVGEVTIQNWQDYDTVLEGCDTVLERLPYFFGEVTCQKQSYRRQLIQLSAWGVKFAFGETCLGCI